MERERLEDLRGRKVKGAVTVGVLSPAASKLLVVGCLGVASLALYIQVKLTPAEVKSRRRWLYTFYYTVLVLVASLVFFGYQYLREGHF